ncbi:unnamed protein product [Trifolium pratense]|uniref:Uncharacterized protein n=1 Tax=Trifolium pratense TaxID=57577 RepID=A0ACB0KI40_TRIPR|nr:unnamed protein product [Trifolium pratense]
MASATDVVGSNLHRAAVLTLVLSVAIGKDLEEARVTAANKIRLWNKGVDSESFNPRYKLHEMRLRLSSGEPDNPLVVHVGHLGVEKSLNFLKLKPLLHDELIETMGKAAHIEMEKYDWREATKAIHNQNYNTAIWFWRKKKAQLLLPFQWLTKHIFTSPEVV